MYIMHIWWKVAGSAPSFVRTQPQHVFLGFDPYGHRHDADVMCMHAE